jgi:5-methylcytosine-specific restriction endonuclease McrA
MSRQGLCARQGNPGSPVAKGCPWHLAMSDARTIVRAPQGASKRLGGSMAWAGSTRRARLPRDWQGLRRQVLARHPVCQVCHEQPSTQADHIIPGDDHSLANLRGVCAWCHQRKSSAEGGRARAARRPSRKRPAERHPGLIMHRSE